MPFLAALVAHEDVAPFLAAVRASSAEDVAEEVARGEREPEAYGVMVVEVDGEPVGTVTWERVNRRSRIASSHSLTTTPHNARVIAAPLRRPVG